MDTSWRTNRTMSPRDYDRVITALGLNQSSAARFLGVSQRTSARYISGEAQVPAATVMLLRLMAQLGLKHGVKTRRAKRRPLVPEHLSPTSP